MSFGTDRPASQFLMVVSVTPSASANCFWVRNCRTLSLIRGNRSDFFIVSVHPSTPSALFFLVAGVINAICCKQQRFAIAYRSQIPLILLRRRLFGRYRTTPEDDTGANREPECLPSWNNRVGSALLLAARVGASLFSPALKCDRCVGVDVGRE